MTAATIFKAATMARDAGEYGKAESLLLSIDERDRDYATFYAVLGHVRWELGKIDEAIKSFRQAIGLAPNSEVVSVGLFHCLWEANRIDAAFEEMKRFLATNKSEEYSRLLADINKE